MPEKPKTFYTYMNAAEAQAGEISTLMWEERGTVLGDLQEMVDGGEVDRSEMYYLYECRPIAVLLRPSPVIVAEEPLL